ncbi:non-muscle cofilin 1, partial [Triplophysa rosa]
QASGVAISDEVVKYYDLIRVRKQGEQERERFKLVMMRISDDQKSIIVDHDNCLRNKDVENAADIFEAVVSKLPPKECRYCLYDCHYATTESVKEDLIFIMWAPESANLKSKMLYASSRNDLKKKIPGLKFEWQVNDPSDIHKSCLVEKLGGPLVKSLEGKAM